MSSGDDAFFVARAGAVWACFLDGKPATRLGSEEEFWKAVTTFYEERHPEESPAATSTPSLQPSQPPPPVQPRTADGRVARRHDVSIVGRVFTSGGSREAIISDLSTTGCRFDDYSGRSMPKGTHLTIRIGTVGPVPATVRWAEGTTVGVLFDAALHPSVLEHIRLQFGRPG